MACLSIMIVIISFAREKEKLLLSRGADVDSKSEHSTPLHLDAGEGHKSTVKVPLDTMQM
jgi:hypothetical protein